MNSITKILDKFDKKTLVKKVIPALCDVLKDPALSNGVLTNLFHILSKDKFITTTEFRLSIWPAIAQLCKSKELPAQTLFSLLKNAELLLKFSNTADFSAHMLPLIQKSLECGVAKLQLLAIEQIEKLFKSLDYQTFKTALMPRVLTVLENTQNVEVKLKVLRSIITLQEGIDETTMKHNVFKTLEKLRSKETDPEICMLVLKIYEKSSDVLGADEIGLKVLPGIIPMLVSGNLNKI